MGKYREMSQRYCRRCLTGQMDESAYFKNLHEYIANLDEDIKVDNRLYLERLTCCEACKRLIDGMCNACGCYVELRAAMIKNKCPYQKW